MTKPTIISEAPMSIAEVKGALDKIKKRDGALTFRGNKTEEYVSQFAKLSPKKSAELEKKIDELGIPRLKDVHIKKLADTMPISAKDVKVVLQGFTLTVKQDDMKKIAEAIAEYL